MEFEVEQKFYVEDLGAVERALGALGIEVRPAVVQVDTYFSHPARDFGSTDEAFRLRSQDDENYVTYKGPKIDATTKTRVELELALPDGQNFATKFRDLMEHLDFGVAIHVQKERRTAPVVWRGANVTVALDRVKELGDFVELEITAVEARVSWARETIASLARELGLTRDERRSYSQLLLQRQAAPGED